MFNMFRFKGTGDSERRVTKFLWFPKSINGLWKWLVRATWVEHRVITVYFGIGRYTARFWTENPPLKPNFIERYFLKKKMYKLWQQYIDVSNEYASFSHLRSGITNKMEMMLMTELKKEAEEIKKKLDRK